MVESAGVIRLTRASLGATEGTVADLPRKRHSDLTECERAAGHEKVGAMLGDATCERQVGDSNGCALPLPQLARIQSLASAKPRNLVMPRAARASKSPVPPAVRRSSRQSTPNRDLASPPPAHNTSTPSATRATRQSAAGLPHAPSAPSLAPPVPDVTAAGVTSSPGRGPRKSTTTRALSPRVAARVVRPPLPAHAVNEQMVDDGGARAGAKPPKLHKVKTQTLHLGDDNGTIMIARVKCPVPKNVPG